MTVEQQACIWGKDLERQEVLGRSVLVFAERPKGLAAVLFDAARWGAREHLVDDQRRLTFAETLGAVNRVAEVLAAEGVREGDRVMLLARNSVEWVVSFWALVRLGAVAVLGNAWWSGHEACAAVGAIRPALVLADGARAELVREVAAVVLLDDLRPVVDRVEVAAGVASSQHAEDDVAIVLFTSGTTGAPKGAMLSHRGVIANQHNFLARTRRLPDDLPDDHPVVTSLLSTPLFHTGGIQAILTAMVTGGRLAFLSGRFTPEAVLDLIEREQVSVWAGVPTMVQRVLASPAFEGRDLSSIRAIGFGGAPLPPALAAATAKAFPNARRGVSTNYGSTEAGGIVATAAGADVIARPGTSGRPLPGVEVRIDAPQGEDRGEVLVRSAAVFLGYFGGEEEPVTPDGWLRTGDVGTVDEDGYLYIVDRLKDIIIRGGENIASAHVEAALVAHPAVVQVAVIGLPHEDLGEEVAAVVVLADGQELDEDALRAHARTRLAHFEVPSSWSLRRQPLPETPTGKVDKRSLRAEWAARG